MASNSRNICFDICSNLLENFLNQDALLAEISATEIIILTQHVHSQTFSAHASLDYRFCGAAKTNFHRTFEIQLLTEVVRYNAFGSFGAIRYQFLKNLDMDGI